MAVMGCRCDPGLKGAWGCEEPAQQPVWRDAEENDYYTCPIKWVTGTVLDWYQEYAWYLEMGGSPAWHEMPAKWLDALSMYKASLMQYQEKPKGPDKLQPLKMGVRGRRNGR